MKKILSVFVLVAVMAGAAQAYNAKVYTEQGGAKQVVKSGGEIEVRSGGTVDLQAGSTLNIANAAVIGVISTPTFSNVSVTYGVDAATIVASGAMTAASIAATAHTGATIALTGAADINGAVTIGADGTVSTMAANGAWTMHASVTAPAITGSTSVTSPLYIATGPIRFYSRTKAQVCAIDPTAAGEAYYASDLTALMVSTGTAVNDYAQVDDPTKGCE